MLYIYIFFCLVLRHPNRLLLGSFVNCPFRTWTEDVLCPHSCNSQQTSAPDLLPPHRSKVQWSNRTFQEKKHQRKGHSKSLPGSKWKTSKSLNSIKTYLTWWHSDVTGWNRPTSTNCILVCRLNYLSRNLGGTSQWLQTSRFCLGCGITRQNKTTVNGDH